MAVFQVTCPTANGDDVKQAAIEYLGENYSSRGQIEGPNEVDEHAEVNVSIPVGDDDTPADVEQDLANHLDGHNVIVEHVF